MIRRPGLAAVMVGTLGLGFAAATMVLGLLYALFIRPMPFLGAPGMTLILGQDIRQEREVAVALPTVRELRERTAIFEDIAGVSTERSATLTTADSVESLTVVYATGNYFPMMKIPAVKGRTLQPGDDIGPGAPMVIMLSYDLWQNRFDGDPDIVGKRLTIGDLPVTVVGVATERYRGHYWSAVDGWLPASNAATLMGEKFWSGWDLSWLRAFGRLRAGFSVEQGDQELDAILAELAKTEPALEYQRALVTDVARYYFSNQHGRLRSAGIGAGLLLLLCGINVANLLLTRDTLRSGEVAVRSAVGASRGTIIRQLLVESLLLSFMGAMVGCLLARVGMRYLVAVSTIPPVTFDHEYLDTPVLLAVFLGSLMIGLAFSCVPILQALRADLHAPLKRTSDDTSPGVRRAMAVLSVIQVALVVVVLTMSAVLLQSYLDARFGDAGFDANELLSAQLDFHSPVIDSDEGAGPFLRDLLSALESEPGVAGATLSAPRSLPQSTLRTEVIIEGKAEGSEQAAITAYRQFITPGFFAVTGIALLEGEDFTYQDDASKPLKVIVNHLLAERQWPGESAIGKRIRLLIPGGDITRWWTVTGVVEASKNRGFVGTEGRDMDLYLPLLQERQSSGFLLVRASREGDHAQLPSTVRRAMERIDPRSPVLNVQWVRPRLEAQAGDEYFVGLVMSLFALLALVVVVVGLYGMLTYAVRRRTREIGLRMAVGAAPRKIFWMVTLQSMKTVLVGLVLGWLACFALSRVLFVPPGEEHFGLAYPPVWLAVGLLIVLTSLLALWLPVRHATGIQPVIALHDE